ncbi:MAG: hypothetical protein LAP21_15950 [Acidobacteriia bacterium]|nr:hypothetical protein [Terriglobia bacterium]
MTKLQGPDSQPSAAFTRIYDAVFKWGVVLVANWACIYIVLRLLKFT